MRGKGTDKGERVFIFQKRRKKASDSFENKNYEPRDHLTVWKLNLVYWVVLSSLPPTRGRAMKKRNTEVTGFCFYVDAFACVFRKQK